MTPSQEIYYWRKSHGMCVACGKQKAFGKFVKCPDCLYKNYVRQCEYLSTLSAEKNAERIRKQCEYQKQRRVYRIENQLCVNCGKKLTDTKFKNCPACRAIRAKQATESKRRKKDTIAFPLRGNGEYCYLCCKPVEHHGDKLCNACKERQSQILITARETINRELFKQKHQFPKGYFKNKE